MSIDRTVLRDAGGGCLRRPVVYLDQSTLVDAFHGKRREGDEAAVNAELAEVVEEVARRGTLCLSIIHVFETAQWPRRVDAIAMADWLNGLDPLWFQMEGANEDELANEVRRRVGLKAPPVQNLPIHHAMTAAIRPSLKASVLADAAQKLLSAPDVASLIRTIHGHARLGEMAEHVRARSIDLLTRTHEDRSSIPEGTPRKHVDEVLEGKLRKHIEDEACRLIATAPVERGESYPDDDKVRAAVQEALDDRDAIPLTKIGYHLSGQVADGIRRADPQSGRFRANAQSFVWDARHASAAAVVDVFTCDRFTDGVMGDFRTSRGMERQVSVRGGRDRAALVAELRRQCAERH